MTSCDRDPHLVLTDRAPRVLRNPMLPSTPLPMHTLAWGVDAEFAARLFPEVTGPILILKRGPDPLWAQAALGGPHAPLYLSRAPAPAVMGIGPGSRAHGEGTFWRKPETAPAHSAHPHAVHAVLTLRAPPAPPTGCLRGPVGGPLSRAAPAGLGAKQWTPVLSQGRARRAAVASRFSFSVRTTLQPIGGRV